MVYGQVEKNTVIYCWWGLDAMITIIIVPEHDKTNKMTCAPSEDSDQPGHPPSLIRNLIMRSVGI